jgi:hypothetical protein
MNAAIKTKDVASALTRKGFEERVLTTACFFTWSMVSGPAYGLS